MSEVNKDVNALIHLRVPAMTKARWVRASRADGMRLTDWIIRKVDSAPPDRAEIAEGEHDNPPH